eukprot:13868-Heterococcus_DN1.PRE.2
MHTTAIESIDCACAVIAMQYCASTSRHNRGMTTAMTVRDQRTLLSARFVNYLDTTVHTVLAALASQMMFGSRMASDTVLLTV